MSEGEGSRKFEWGEGEENGREIMSVPVYNYKDLDFILSNTGNTGSDM